MDPVRVGVVFVLAVTACTRTDADVPAPPPPVERVEAIVKRGAPFDDAQIAAIVVAANQVDIDTALTKEAVELVTRLHVTPIETDASRGLRLRGAAVLANLEVLDADAFDRAYVDNEVEYHKAVIHLVASQLIPSAENAELKALLAKAKPLLETHLQHAEHVQATFSGAVVPDAGHSHGH